MKNTTAIGQLGETIACDHLAAQGYAIIDRNVHMGNVEIDILAQHDSQLVVVEVKTRRDDHLDPNFDIDRKKIMRLCRAAATYVKIHDLPLEIRLDAILVTTHADGSHTLSHLPDIALPPRLSRR